MRRVILIRVHPLVEQQQLRRVPLHDQHQAVAAVGEAGDHVGLQAAGVDDAAEALEMRHLAGDDRAVGADVLLVHEWIEAARELGGDFRLEPFQVAGTDRPAALQFRPGERFRRLDVVHRGNYELRIKN